MAVLGDEQASGIRGLLLDQGAFQAVHAFPQKDNVAARVFADAKLSTALFLYRKSQDVRIRNASFPTRAHSGRFVTNDTTPLELNANSISLYDPANLTILSCSQADWDLLEELEPSRFSRLRDHAQFFQGEVNHAGTREAGNARRVYLRLPSP